MNRHEHETALRTAEKQAVPIVDERIEAYLDGLIGGTDTVAKEMEAEAAERRFPIVGPHVGRLLYLLARMIGAKDVLEMGSGFGYSAYWFARALPAGGRLVLTDTDPANHDRALDYLSRAGFSARIEFHVGDALAIADRAEGPFDIVFNDVDKHAYPETIDRAARLLRSGGLFVTDNALWHGKVVAPANGDVTTAGVVEFNRRMFAHRGFESVILPVRDGVLVARKR